MKLFCYAPFVANAFISSFLTQDTPHKYIFVEYLWNIPMIYSQNIWKEFPMKFKRIFPNNVPGILFCGIFVENSHDIFPEYLEKVPNEFPGNIPK